MMIRFCNTCWKGGGDVHHPVHARILKKNRNILSPKARLTAGATVRLIVELNPAKRNAMPTSPPKPPLPIGQFNTRMGLGRNADVYASGPPRKRPSPRAPILR